MADKDGISYDWSIDAKMAGVDEGIKKLDEAVAGTHKLHKASQEAAEAVQHHGAMHYKAGEAWHKHRYEMEGVGQTVREVKGKFLEFGEAIGAVLAFELLKEGIEKIKELGMEILHAAAGAEKMELAMKLTVGQEGAKEVLEWIDKISSKTAFTDDQLKGWSIDLLNAGVKMKDIDKFIAAGLDVSARGGDMGTAINAMMRAQMTGKIEGRALRGLRIGIDQIKTLPGFEGLTDLQAHKRMEKHPVTLDQLMGLIAGPDKILGDQGIQGGQTMEARLKNLRTLPEQYFQKFAGSPAFEMFKDKLGEIFDSLDPNSERGGRIFASLERSFTKVVDWIAKIDFDKWATTLEEKVLPRMEQLFGFIGSIADAVDRMVRGFEKMGQIIHDYTPVGWLADLSSKGGDVHDKMQAEGALPSQQKHEGAVGGTADWMNKYTPVGFLNDTLFNGDWYKRRFGGQSEEVGDAIGAGVVVGLEGQMSNIDDTASSAGGVAIDAMSTKIKAHSPSEVFEELGMNVGEGFIQGIQKSRGGIDDVVQGAFAVPAAGGGRSLGGGGVSVSIPITVQAHAGQSPEELGRVVGEAVRDIALPLLIDALEQAGGEAGA